MSVIFQKIGHFSILKVSLQYMNVREFEQIFRTRSLTLYLWQMFNCFSIFNCLNLCQLILNTANVGSTRDLISQNKICIEAKDCKADTTWKTFRDTNMSQNAKWPVHYIKFQFVVFNLLLLLSRVDKNNVYFSGMSNVTFP